MFAEAAIDRCSSTRPPGLARVHPHDPGIAGIVPERNLTLLETCHDESMHAQGKTLPRSSDGKAASLPAHAMESTPARKRQAYYEDQLTFASPEALFLIA